MTTTSRRSAALFGLALALALPKKVPCEVPGRSCEVHDRDNRVCQPTDVEPLAVYGLEWVLSRDLPLAYSTRLDCV